MKLKQVQTDKILKKLKDYDLHVLTPPQDGSFTPDEVSEEYFNEKVNEALQND